MKTTTSPTRNNSEFNNYVAVNNPLSREISSTYKHLLDHLYTVSDRISQNVKTSMAWIDIVHHSPEE
jgi:hypothetical protein